MPIFAAYLTLHYRPYLIRLQSSKVVNDVFLFGLLELPVRLELRVRDHVIGFNRNLTKKIILGTFINVCRGVDSQGVQYRSLDLRVPPRCKAIKLCDRFSLLAKFFFEKCQLKTKIVVKKLCESCPCDLNFDLGIVFVIEN